VIMIDVIMYLLGKVPGSSARVYLHGWVAYGFTWMSRVRRPAASRTALGGCTRSTCSRPRRVQLRACVLARRGCALVAGIRNVSIPRLLRGLTFPSGRSAFR
jgi:hypothetical protein